MQVSRIQFNTYNSAPKNISQYKKEQSSQAGRYHEYKPVYYTPIFTAASDITAGYLLKNRAKFLPKRILEKCECLVRENKADMRLEELHKEVYANLFSAKSLDVLKAEYPEFEGVIDAIALKDNRSKAIKAIKAKMPLEDFTLDYIKRLYAPTPETELVEFYNFPNRSILNWLNNTALKIPKLPGNYLTLYKSSTEEGNKRIAELSKLALERDPQRRRYFFKRAAEAHRTPEYRKKKRQEMIDFYERNPEAAEKVGLISQMTWDKCPEIKEAFGRYFESLSRYKKSVFSKRNNRKNLNDIEARTLKGVYKSFWKTHPEFIEQYRQARLEVIKELNNNCLK